jgi:hypothetical protein
LRIKVSMTHVTERSSRKVMRRDLGPVVVPVLCGHCRRAVAELYSSHPQAPPRAYWSETASGVLSPVGRAVHWRCRCGKGDYPLRGDKLTSAFLRVAGRDEKRERVIVLPNDLRL